jgi:hypothetical protein
MASFFKGFFLFPVASRSAGPGVWRPAQTPIRACRLDSNNKSYAILGGRSKAGSFLIAAGQSLPRLMASTAPLRKLEEVFKEGGWVAQPAPLGVHHQAQLFGRGLPGAQTPPVHGKSTGQCHDDLFASARGGL